MFSVFKLVPRHYDEIVEMPREALARVRRQERAIMIACVRRARMPRKVFLKEFQGNEISIAWVNKHTKAKKDYSAALEEQTRRDRSRAEEAESDHAGDGSQRQRNQGHQPTHVAG